MANELRAEPDGNQSRRDHHDASLARTPTGIMVDPLFATPVWHHDLRLPHSACTRATADWLTHAVTRTPRDLAAHTLRINTLQDIGDSVGLADALADLWSVLGAAGCELKARVLQAVAPDLPDGAIEYFSKPMVPMGDAVPWGGCPVLARGFSGRPVVVRLSQTNG